ncbi:ESPL1 protein, partial [Oriolus oriolus]|nr:ESPL1 protein [Oriolus oriolus]
TSRSRGVPAGVTVCQLSLAGGSPGAVGDALLLTRLERDRDPVSVRIPTQHCQVSGAAFGLGLLLLLLLGDFPGDPPEFLGPRSHSHSRRFPILGQSLIRSLDSEVLGCWRGLLLPREPGNAPLEEQELSQLLRELRECGWDSP